MGDGEKSKNGDGNCWLATLESARIAAIAGNTGVLLVHHEEVGTASSWLVSFFSILNPFSLGGSLVMVSI